MLRFIVAGDLHYRGTNPRNRLGNYREAVKQKLSEIFGLAMQWEAKAILLTGDIFDSAEVTNSVLLELAGILEQAPVKIYTCIGKHDIYGYATETYGRSSLKVLQKLLPDKLVVLHRPHTFTQDTTRVCLSTEHYSAKMDVDGHGYAPLLDRFSKDTFYIHLTHGMLLDHVPPFDRYTLIDAVKTAANLVISGYYHPGFGVVRRSDGKIFLNPGSLTRLKATNAEIARKPQAALVTIDEMQCSIKMLPLKTAKAGAEILDRTQIEAENQREYAMEQFAALMRAKTGTKVLCDVNRIVESIAAAEDIPPAIVERALAEIDAQRSVLGG